MSSTKNLLEINYHDDDDTGMYHIGEIDCGIKTVVLKNYIEHYGVKGRDEILAHLGLLAYNVQCMFLDTVKCTDAAAATAAAAKSDN